MKVKIFFIISIFIILLIPNYVEANNAQDISKQVKVTYNNQTITKLSDNNTNTKINILANKEISIISDSPIYCMYIKYEKKSSVGVVSYNEQQKNIGENGFLHEYIELENITNEIKIIYNENVEISEIYCFTEGDVPQWVQKWKVQKGEVDLMLFSTHSDDEHLFFAGLLPTYVAKGYNVQVIYVTNHNNQPTRLHEQLDGLWNVGITNYPIISEFPDAFSNSLQGAINNLKSAGFTEEDVIKFQVELIRKYKPLVVVGHDINGEYKHGQHMLNIDALKQAIEKSKDENYYVETVEKYGIWDTPKLYIHLYNENQIIMDYDIPLDYFGGKTAYEVSKIGYSYHKSQQYTWFTKWLNGPNNSYTSIKQITTYSPTIFGLYYTTVGEDVNKNDMFENIDKTQFRPQEEIQNEIVDIETEDVIKTNNKTIYIIIGALIIAIIVLVPIIKSKNK